MYFFFKQKTAYEMRISDWSSDVCSSDLTNLACVTRCDSSLWRARRQASTSIVIEVVPTRTRCANTDTSSPTKTGWWNFIPSTATVTRSEEHTSELQSLMRISYAVFCLKKKKKNTHTQDQTHNKQTYQSKTDNV